MSGRLIILPKKTYCPWKPENVERVLRDERLERERIETQEKEQRQRESRQRLQKLKGNESDSVVVQQQNEQHVNLFESEEQAMMKNETAVAVRPTKALSSGGIMPVRLDSVVEKNKVQPFYVRGSVVRNDEKRKARMDPMKAFTSNEAITCDNRESGQQKDEPSRKRGHYGKRSSRYDDSSDSQNSSSRRSSSRRRRDKKRKKKHSKSDKNKTPSIEELRRRRQEREQKESQREKALRQQAGSRNGRNRRYQDQFYPSLSRR